MIDRLADAFQVGVALAAYPHPRPLPARGRGAASGTRLRYEFGPRSIDTGCQRRRPLAGSTVGLTHDIGQRPLQHERQLLAYAAAAAWIELAEADALCG